jgi:flavin-binding protein dodecin
MGRRAIVICRVETAIRGGVEMSDSVYRVTEVIGVSSESWEAAARNAVETAAKTIRDLRVAELTRHRESGSAGQWR